LDDRLGKLHFGLMLVGFHLTFDVMFIVGLAGMPRHIYTYMPDRPWTTLNQIISFGGLLQGLGILVFVANLFYSYFRGREAGPDPWDAWTLEWATSSPPPPYNFASEPNVASRRPLWDLKHPEDPDYAYE
jgi:cytochrome c oxidase subunit 1